MLRIATRHATSLQTLGSPPGALAAVLQRRGTPRRYVL